MGRVLFKLIYVFYFGRLHEIQLTFPRNYGADIFYRCIDWQVV